MSGHQEFRLNNIKIKFYKDDNVLSLVPGLRVNKQKVALLKNQLETFLTVDSIKTEPTGLSMQLAKGAGANVPEFLRSLGAEGGESIEDAASIANAPAEEAAEEAEQDQALPMPDPQQQQVGVPQDPMLAAGLSIPGAYVMLYENAFGERDVSRSPSGRSRKPGRRTGKYWDPIERITGKNRSKINEKDILGKRRQHSRKPDSESRNKVLRSLDKAFNYFHKKKEREYGIRQAEQFADDYYATDDLSPGDYSLEKKAAQPLGSDGPISGMKEEEFLPSPDTENDDEDINGPDFAEFAEILNQGGEDSYDDIEITDDPFI